MLVLSRREGERIHIGEDVVITVLATRKGRTQLGIEAPGKVRIDRQEVRQRITAGGDESPTAERAVPKACAPLAS
jgi:carbon storage regulator